MFDDRRTRTLKIDLSRQLSPWITLIIYAGVILDASPLIMTRRDNAHNVLDCVYAMDCSFFTAQIFPCSSGQSWHPRKNPRLPAVPSSTTMPPAWPVT